MHKYVIIILALMALVACGSRKAAEQGADAGETGRGTATAGAVAAVSPSADSLMAFVKAQMALGPRTPGSEANRQCRELITNTLRRYGADTVLVQTVPVTVWDGSRHEAANILGRFNTAASRRVLLLAHYDTRPWADQDPVEANRHRPVPGANDGASGVAGLLEMARLMAQKTPAVGVDLLFVDAEDSGNSGDTSVDEESWCLGTQQWVTAMPYGSDSRPVFGILLDMIGGRDARFHREYFSDLQAKAVVDLVWQNAARAGLSGRFPDERGGAITDDHIYINRAGIPCIDIIENRNAETGSFNPTWHTVADDTAAIDPQTMADVVQVVANTIYDL